MQTLRRAIGAAVATAVALVPLSVVAAGPAHADDPAGALGNVVINEVSSNGFTYNGAASTDFIELHNMGTANVDLTGYKLIDSGDIAGAMVLDGVLPAGGYAVVIPPSFGLGSADNARLFAPDGVTLIDSVVADGSTWPAHQVPSSARVPDGTGAFAATSLTGPTYPTPGGPNGLTTAQSFVTINEYSSTGNPDFVEIHNGGPAEVDLTGWKLADGNGTPNVGDEIILGGASAVVPANGFLTVRTEDLTQTDHTFVAGGFGLNGLDDVWLSLPDGTLVATTSGASGATDLHPDPSWGRTSTGTGLWKVTSGDTPSAVNTFPVPTDVPPLDPNWDTIEINEISSLNVGNPGNPGFGDAVELVNTGTTDVSIEGWWQVDSGLAASAVQLTLADLKVWNGSAFEPAAAMVVPAGGYVAFQSKKGLSGEGDGVKVYGPSATPGSGQLVDEAAYGDGDAGVSDTYESDSLAFAACPDGSDEFWRVTESSFGRDNTAACATKSRRLDTPVVVNEIANLDGKVELLNTGVDAVDISGWELLDSSATVVHTVPATTTLAPGAFYVAEGVTGLDSADSLAIRDTEQASAVAHRWFEDGIASYSRCELFGDVSYVETPSATFGAANACPQITTTPWPGSEAVTTVDEVNGFGDGDGNGEGDVSGVAFDPTDPSILWVVQNKNTLHQMHEVGGVYVPVAGWDGGKKLHFANGAGKVDSEGVTVGPDGFVYVTSERDNDNSSVSSNKILRYDVSTVTAETTDLTAETEWDVNEFVTTGTNLGLEGITFVPDSYLVESGWKVDGVAYAAADHPTPGLYVVAVEGTGALHFFSLMPGAAPVEVKVEASGFPWSMDVAYDADRGAIWTLCDDSCGGIYNLLEVVDGDLAPRASYARPAGMPNLNNEGMAIAPASTCTDGAQQVVWADDGDTDGFSLRAGTLPCMGVTVTSPTVKYGKAANVTVTVPGATSGVVTVTVGGKALLPALLADDGTATVQVPKVLLKPRSSPYDIRAAYRGDGVGDVGAALGTLTVVKGKAALGVSAPSKAVVKKTRAKVVVKVSNPDGVPVTGKVRISGGGLDPQTVKLVDGKAAVTLAVFRSTGRKKLTISYLGSGLLAGKSMTRTITVVRG